MSFPASIHIFRATWTCPSDITGVNLSKPIGPAQAYSRAREQILSYPQVTLRWLKLLHGIIPYSEVTLVKGGNCQKIIKAQLPVLLSYQHLEIYFQQTVAVKEF